ncbi:MAG: hypothetical protein HWE34_11975 [Methylocystaceae bacterium]|nr:hypothetical protein [Methylocystaceae bacterium]
MEMTDDEFLATRTLKLALNKLVPRAVKFGSIDGYLGQNGDQNYKHERTDSYILACKTQNCVSYTENLDGTGKFPYANRAAFHQKPLSTNDYRFRCLKAFAHLAQLNGATENSDLFK